MHFTGVGRGGREALCYRKLSSEGNMNKLHCLVLDENFSHTTTVRRTCRNRMITFA